MLQFCAYDYVCVAAKFDSVWFNFADHVFDEMCSNSRVYDLLTKDIIHAVVEGFNGNFKIRIC